MIHPSDNLAARTWLRELEQSARGRGFSTACWGEREGLPLLGFQRSADGNRPRIYLSAGIHGDEPAGPQAIRRLLQLDLLDRRASWTICPLLNPVGWLAGTRETPDGIDLNRDYRDPQSSEAKSHCAWIRKMPPHDLYLSLHEDWEATGFYLYEINTSSHQSFAMTILERVARVIPLEPLECIDEHVVCSRGYIAHPPEPDEALNWPEAIYHCKLYPHLSYTFETPSSIALEKRVEALVITTTTAVRKFLTRWRTGNTR